MGLFDTGAPTNLEQALTDQANTAALSTQDAYTQARKRLVAKEAAGGRLMSGVSAYPLADLAKEGASSESGIYSNLAAALGMIPSEDWENQRQYQRNLSLAELIGEMQKPTGLMQGLGAAGSGAMAGGM
jgi:hypothetical protein